MTLLQEGEAVAPARRSRRRKKRPGGGRGAARRWAADLPAHDLDEGLHFPLSRTRRHGEFGLGAFDSLDRLDGEMVMPAGSRGLPECRGAPPADRWPVAAIRGAHCTIISACMAGWLTWIVHS